jgi:hypothetical protein
MSSSLGCRSHRRGQTLASQRRRRRRYTSSPTRMTANSTWLIAAGAAVGLLRGWLS